MTTFHYRDKLTRKELMPALGAGLGAGLGVAVVVAYVTQLMLRKRTLASGSPEPAAAPPKRSSR